MAFSTPKETGNPNAGGPGSPSKLSEKAFALRDANSKTLTESRREKLLSIRKREEMKDVLVKKLCERVDKRTGKSSVDNANIIKEEVDSFLGHASITESNLKKLEKKVQQKTSGEKIGGEGEDDVISHYSQASSMKSVGSGKDGAKGLEEKKMSFIADWKLLDEYAMLLHQQDSVKQKGRAKAAQKKLYDDLTAQVEANKTKDDYKKIEDQKYHEESLKELELWRISEEEKIADMKKKNLIEKKMRDEQLALEKEEREKEEKIKAKEELDMVEKIKKEIILEEEKRKKKIENQKAHMAVVFKENQQNKAKKEAEVQEQIKQDIKTIKEYNRVLDKQDKARQAEKEQRLEKQKILLERMKQTVQAQAEAKGQEDEERAAKQKEEADLRNLEAAVMKQQKLEVLRGETRDFQLTQIQAKMAMKQQSLELKRMQAHVLGEDTKQWDQAEYKKIQARKLKNYEHQKELQAQILEKEKRAKTVEMSKAEESINRDLLEHVYKALKDKKTSEE